MIGHQDWADDRSLDVVWNRSERSDELNPVIRAWTTARTTAEIVELAALLRIPAIEVGNGATIPLMDHFAAEGFYDVNPDGGFLQPAAPFRFHPPLARHRRGRAGPGTGPAHPHRNAAAHPRPAPSGGAAGAAPATAPGRPSTASASPTSRRSGPVRSSTHTMAMFGADVIHVESIGAPRRRPADDHWHPPTEPQWWEWSSYFHATNTNKRGVTLDLATDRGRAPGPRGWWPSATSSWRTTARG